MLSAHTRKLYTDALRPPSGMTFDEGVGLTYSLDLDTLLTVPLQLALFAGERPGEDLKDGVAVLEALRRTAERLLVFCQQGRIHVPRGDQVLYGLLESVVVEVSPKKGGVFHPKVWAFRFVDPEGKRAPSYRLLVLSRNITFDRSWDVCLRLEGEATSRPIGANAELTRLLDALPGLTRPGLAPGAKDRLHGLSEELRRVDWDLPDGFESVRFHALGVGGKQWMPAQSDALTIVSPFLESRALKRLAKTSLRPTNLVSRQEELDRVATTNVLSLFDDVYILDEAAETEDGEEIDESEIGLVGLHAKVYLAERQDRTRVALGSANATAAALLGGGNVELIAELEGPSRRVGRVADFVDKDGIGDVLTAYQQSEGPIDEDLAARAAEEALNAARESLIRASLSIRCEGSGDGWTLVLHGGEPVVLAGIAKLQVRPVSLASEHLRDAAALCEGREVAIGPCALASITGLIAFELAAEGHPSVQRFVLNLPLVDAPQGRFAAVTRAVVANRDGFVRYLLLLLAEFGDDGLARWLPGASGMGNRWRKGATLDDLPLFEHLVRALIEDPSRLRTVSNLVEEIRSSEGGETLLTEEFLGLWKSFDALLKEES